jgi:hypothetical protein
MILAMDIVESRSLQSVWLALSVILCGAALAMAFWGWQLHASDIFLTAIESGLSWCL